MIRVGLGIDGGRQRIFVNSCGVKYYGGQSWARYGAYGRRGVNNVVSCSKKKTGKIQGDAWGNRNRLSSDYYLRNGSSSPHEGFGRAPVRDRISFLERARDLLGRLSYVYYNWREDTFSDLQLLLFFNIALLALGSQVQGSLTATGTLWDSVYSVLVVVLGQELPDAKQSELPTQIFAVVTAALGIASFALILALIEQVVLETLESNVKRGSKVYESGHYCLVAWGESSRDIEQLQRIVQELCAANRRSGGVTIAILVSHREKLELESVFRQGVPAERRYGSQIVCRKGSPLDPSDLDMISATTAKSVIICGDYSISCRESDAVVLRAAVLLDEAVMAQQGQYEGAGMEGRGAPRPHIVAEIQSKAGLELLNYACSPNVKAVPTTRLNTARTVRLLRHPVTAVVSHDLFQHSSRCHVSIFSPPEELYGKTISEMVHYFPYSIPVGFFNRMTRLGDINPDPGKKLSKDQDLIILQSTYFGADYCLKTKYIDTQEDEWDPLCFSWNSSDADIVYEKHESVCFSGRPRLDWNTDMEISPNDMYASIGPSGGDCSKEPQSILVCGWPGGAYTSELVRALDSGDVLSPGSSITLINNHPWETIKGFLDFKLSNITLRHIKCDPREKDRLNNAIDISKFSAAIIMQDTLWLNGGVNNEHAAYALSQEDMLRLDATILTVQLNIRYLLEQNRSSEINIIAEKLASEGETRFENRSKLPIGASISSSSFSAKALAVEGLHPGLVITYFDLGSKCGIYVQDASSFVEEGEKISFAVLQARCASVQLVLMGYYYVPMNRSTLDPIHLDLNPQGIEERCRKRVWNSGDGSCKFIVAAQKSGGKGRSRKNELQLQEESETSTNSS
eukprot:jgi/Picsp_1/3663/NSC_06500-R1_probable secreted protein